MGEGMRAVGVLLGHPIDFSPRNETRGHVSASQTILAGLFPEIKTNYAWPECHFDPISIGVLIFVGAICAAVVVAVGRANHRAVKSQLEPQREKLKTFLATFEDSP